MQLLYFCLNKLVVRSTNTQDHKHLSLMLKDALSVDKSLRTAVIFTFMNAIETLVSHSASSV